jgi:hypothetical protein
MQEHMSLKDVARLVQIKPYRIAYAISVGLIPEPDLRVGNHRVFQSEDVKRVAAHFGVALPGKERPHSEANGRSEAVPPTESTVKAIRNAFI